MQVQVLLFGAERRAAGTDRAIVLLAGPGTCEDLRLHLGQAIPALQPHLSSARFAVNGQFVPHDHPLAATDEIALIGLVSGG